MQNETTPAEGQNSAQTESESALRGAACSPVFSNTPETDRKIKRICGNWNNAGDRIQEFVLADVARKLERERDEARETLRKESTLACDRTRLLHDEMEKSWNLTQEVESLIKQRDEARAMARDMRNQVAKGSKARLTFPWENGGDHRCSPGASATNKKDSEL